EPGAAGCHVNCCQPARARAIQFLADGGSLRTPSHGTGQSRTRLAGRCAGAGPFARQLSVALPRSGPPASAEVETHGLRTLRTLPVPDKIPGSRDVASPQIPLDTFQGLP